MAYNDFVQNIQNADTDAIAFQRFMQGAASEIVKRRIAGDTKTLDYFLAFLRGLELVYSQQNGEVDVNGVKVKTVTQAIKDAINASAVANGAADALIVTQYNRILRDKLSDFSISIKDFGAKGDGLADDTQAVKDFIDCVLKSGKAGFVPSGIYKVSEQIVFDMGLYSISRFNGFKIYGEGLRRSIFKSYYKNDSAFIIKSTNQSQNGNCFYPELVGIGFENNAPYPCVQVGQRDFSDEINAVVFNFSANCGDISANACGLELNGVYQGDLNVTCNAGGTSTLGDALRIRQAQFLRITGSGGNAGNSVHFIDGYSFANVFTNWDAEEVKTCIKIDTATASSNTFVGGQFSWSVTAIDATAGSNNLFINPNFGLSNNIVAGDVGIAVQGQGKGFGIDYQPPTVFSSNKNSDALVSMNAKSGYSAGLIWQIDNSNKFRLDSDGNNLVARAWNKDMQQFLDAFNIDTAGVLNIDQSKVNYFGLQTQAVGRQIVSGSKGGNAALSSLIAALAKFGLITDNTT